MQGIKDRVAIIGMGCCKFGELWDKTCEDMLVDASKEAFKDAGLETKDIQAAWIGTYTSGITGQGLANTLKFDYIPVTRVENLCCTGTEAIRGAAYAIAAGVCDVALAAGVEKLKDSGETGLGWATTFFEHDGTYPPIPPATFFAEAATKYFQRYGLSTEEGKRVLARISVKNHHNGSLNPKAHLRREITLEQAMNAPIVSSPLGLYDCCGVSDGAAVAILCRADMAKDFTKDYAMIKSLSIVVGAKQAELRQDFDFSFYPENVKASKYAYAEAGIKNPREEIDLIELHDCFTINELMTCEDLGITPYGKYKEDSEAGFFDLDGGGVPVNTDGGLKCFGHPIGASGIRMTYEVYNQILGRAGDHQLKKADIGIAHNIGGNPGRFTSAITILGR